MVIYDPHFFPHSLPTTNTCTEADDELMQMNFPFLINPDHVKFKMTYNTCLITFKLRDDAVETRTQTKVKEYCSILGRKRIKNFNLSKCPISITIESPHNCDGFEFFQDYQLL